MIYKINLILSTSPQLQPAKKLRKTANLVLRQRLSYGKPRRNNTGKELDTETGLYYYGARYLDPKASRWLSGDPAVGEYIPVAPVSDEARKRNGNLPGMGGVFNYVNLHVYHYAGNNPVKLVDPDGRDSGYVRNRDSVAWQGHAGVFARNSNGQYVFTEIIPLNTKLERFNPEVLTREENRNNGAFPISLFNRNEIGAVQYTFSDDEQMTALEKMIAFFKEAGFDDYIRFDTTPEQDAAIIATATQLGRDFTDYMIPGNHCGIFTELSLDANGKGINTRVGTRNRDTYTALLMGILPYAIWLQAPNCIGEQLMRYNNGTVVKIE